MKKLLLFLLLIYQKFFTLFSYGSCRYYPSCSEYCKWQIESNNLLKALFFTILRILRCNQLFRGGIDYPIVKKNSFKYEKLTIDKVKYWLVKKDGVYYYVIKNLLYKVKK